MLYSRIKKCRISNDQKLVSIGKLGDLSLTGTFKKKRYQKDEFTPIELLFSKKSKLLQLAHNYNEFKLFGKNYGYRSSLNKSMIEHLKKKKNKLIKISKPENGDLVLDIGSNDGSLLNMYSKNLVRYGVDPTARKFKKYYKKDIKVTPKIFKKNIFKSNLKFKIITAIAMFYDLKNPMGFCKEIEKHLHKDGIFHVEIAYLPDILRLFTFDTFCQEHLTYFSFISFNYLINRTNLKIIDYQRNNINGGSINFNLSFKNSRYVTKDKKLKKLLEYEKKIGINKLKTYKTFYNELMKKAKHIKKKILYLKTKNMNIYGYGASTKGNVLLQLCGLDDHMINGIYDVNKEKFNQYTPGSNIKIISEKKILKNKNDFILFLIWHFKKTIKKKFKNYKLKNTKFIWPFPSIKILNKF